MLAYIILDRWNAVLVRTHFQMLAHTIYDRWQKFVVHTPVQLIAYIIPVKAAYE